MGMRTSKRYFPRSCDGFPAGWAADDFVGLHFRGTELVEAVSSRAGAGAYRVERADGGVREEPLGARLVG